MNWLIIGGAARSGTSAMLKALNQHPEIFLIPEFYWTSQINALSKSIFNKFKISTSKLSIGKVNNQERPGAESLMIKDFLDYIPSENKSLPRVIQAIVESTSNKEKIKYTGEKLPEYWAHLDFKQLAKIFDKNVKLVHVSRSPLHCLSSFKHRIELTGKGKDRFRFNTLNKAAEHLTESFKAYCHFSAHNFTDTLFVKYEDMFYQSSSIADLEDFLGLKLTGTTNYFKGKRYGSLSNLSLSRDELQSLPHELTYLSSIWEADKNFIEKEIRMLWSEKPKPQIVSSRVLWHYSNAFIVKTKEDAKAKRVANINKTMRIHEDLFLHQESRFKAANDLYIDVVTKQAEKELSSQLEYCFGKYSCLDGAPVSQEVTKICAPESPRDLIAPPLEKLLTALISQKIISIAQSDEYRRNLLNNAQDLYIFRSTLANNLHLRDEFLEPNSDGFMCEELDLKPINNLLSAEITFLKSSLPQSIGLDKSLLINLSGPSLNAKHAKLKRILMVIAEEVFGINRISKNSQMHYKLRSATLHHSLSSDTHSYMTRLDEFPKGRLLNMHIDPLFTTRKIILYLENVGINNGPFSYVMNSHKFEVNTSTLLKSKSFGKSNYWQDIYNRAKLKLIPKSMGLTNVFGSTCDEQNHEHWRLIAKKEMIFKSNINAIMFSPSGMHRGGIVSPGYERLALQVIFDLRVDTQNNFDFTN